ncbi:MAG TPA: transglycosylase SLT domain-containing protein [Bacteroidales bacterium]|nr:transglycosylase SLT domain-containing protein [Bacteroidales bacterium]HOK74722.1 transglycosylase SLT domain-containing protein [Bacteroidales bacterium]HOM40426.1 transglycosylase SLT domain-containing protein [Bacteroidales bacterium]HOU29831.1 transglycosylase SLT domain-containing protein [Bacteroidales bacterium]HPP93146.1 transglycosylase SLT domain-containing protein [Bacteroidales bacterium]
MRYKPPRNIYYLLLPALFIGAVFLLSGFFNDSRPEKLPVNGKSPFMLDIKLPDTIYFAGERVPLENFDTRESLEREIIMTAYRHGSTIMIIKRAPRYFPVIEKILSENGIPDDFKYVAVAESELSNMVSPAGAVGFWQILAGTGREHGLEINNEIDERYHLEKSTVVACDYFKKSYEKYGNWTLAAASYNGGRNAIDEQISIQKQTNYYDLLLAEETARYIFRILSYKIIISNPAAYGFEIDKEELYPPLRYTEVKVDTAVADFARFAAHFGTNYKILKFYNPWLRKPYLSKKSGKSYYIKIPEEGSRTTLYENEI